MNRIPRTVWVLSLVSLFTDTASEMLYPVMPIYLRSIGFSVLLIGVLEGIAEATAGLSKGFFGKQSDLGGKRVPFVQWGYALSSISKPMMAAFTYPLWIFLARTIDRIGKGVRTGARDAMLSDAATPETKGRIFGFHRSMDTIGAVLGPSIALVYLYYFPENYLALFLIAFIPGALAVAASLLLKEQKRPHAASGKQASFFSFLGYWKQSPAAYRKLVTGLLLFTLVNSSDVFLLMKAKEAGLSNTLVIGVYIFYNLIYAIFAFPLGIIADKLGLKKIFLSGLILFATVYLGMSVNTSLSGFLVLFFLYGIYAAATEGISKAWISNISLKKDLATAIGTYTGFQSICTLLASSLTGLLWYQLGDSAAFLLTGFATIGIFFYMLQVPDPKQHKPAVAAGFADH
ncbi:MAG: MFS transporter [Sediminibacterium sp.]|nr:MFS transporter [Sediminibacterium sp.]